MSQSHPVNSAAHPRRREEWHRVDAGIYRGMRDGRSVGEIHTVVGGCVAVDPSGTPVGRYATRDDARRALRSTPSARHRAGMSTRSDRPIGGRAGITTAGVLGGIALVGALTAAAAAPWL